MHCSLRRWRLHQCKCHSAQPWKHKTTELNPSSVPFTVAVVTPETFWEIACASLEQAATDGHFTNWSGLNHCKCHCRDPTANLSVINASLGGCKGSGTIRDLEPVATERCLVHNSIKVSWKCQWNFFICPPSRKETIYCAGREATCSSWSVSLATCSL